MDEDVLTIEPRRRRPWVLRAAVLGVVAAAVAAYPATRGSNHRQPVAAPTSPAASASSSTATAPDPVPDRPPWPQQDGACGHSAYRPITAPAALDQRTGLRLLVGDRLHVLDVDARSVDPVRGLPSGAYVVRIARAGGQTYALLTSPCVATPDFRTSVARLRPDGSIELIAHGTYNDLLEAGSHIWAVTYPDSSDAPIVLDPLDGTPPISLPPGIAPVAGAGRLIVASADVDDSYTLALFDPVTSTVKTRIGVASASTVSNGAVLWRAADCGPCPLQLFELATGARTQVPGLVDTMPMVGSAVISPDRRYAAMLRMRNTPAQYEMGHPGNPNELIVLDLTTGAIMPVPQVELWSKDRPGLVYSPDSRWLAIALDDGDGVRVLLWRPGLDRPFESPAYVGGKVAFAPVLAALS